MVLLHREPDLSGTDSVTLDVLAHKAVELKDQILLIDSQVQRIEDQFTRNEVALERMINNQSNGFSEMFHMMKGMLNSLEQLKKKSAPMESSPSSDINQQDTDPLELSKMGEISERVVIDVSDAEIRIAGEHELISTLRSDPSSNVQSDRVIETGEDEAVFENLLPEMSSSICQESTTVHQHTAVCKLEVPLKHSRLVSFHEGTVIEEISERHTVLMFCTQAVCENVSMTFSSDSHLLWCFVKILSKCYWKHNLLVLPWFGKPPPRPPDVIYCGFLEAKTSIYQVRDIFTNGHSLKKEGEATWKTFVDDLKEHFKKSKILISQSEVWNLLPKKLEDVKHSGAHLRTEMKPQSLAHRSNLAKSYPSSLTSSHISVFIRSKFEEQWTEQIDYQLKEMNHSGSNVYYELLVDIQLVIMDMLAVVGSVEDSNNEAQVSCGSILSTQMFLSEVAFSSMPYVTRCVNAILAQLHVSESYETCTINHGILLANKESKYVAFKACKVIQDEPKRVCILSAKHNVPEMLVFDLQEPPNIFFFALRFLDYGFELFYGSLSETCYDVHFLPIVGTNSGLSIFFRGNIKELVANALTEVVLVEVMKTFDTKTDRASDNLSYMLLKCEGSYVIWYCTNHQTSVLSSIRSHESVTWNRINTSKNIYMMRGITSSGKALSVCVIEILYANGGSSEQMLGCDGNKGQCYAKLSIWTCCSILLLMIRLDEIYLPECVILRSKFFVNAFSVTARQPIDIYKSEAVTFGHLNSDFEKRYGCPLASSVRTCKWVINCRVGCCFVVSIWDPGKFALDFFWGKIYWSRACVHAPDIFMVWLDPIINVTEASCISRFSPNTFREVAGFRYDYSVKLTDEWLTCFQMKSNATRCLVILLVLLQASTHRRALVMLDWEENEAAFHLLNVDGHVILTCLLLRLWKFVFKDIQDIHWLERDGTVIWLWKTAHLGSGVIIIEILRFSSPRPPESQP